MRKAISGFTIVELLIVIVVIAILATISIVAYGGIQTRAYDSVRSSDMSSMVKALELYYAEEGEYPASVGPSGGTGWEISNNVASGRVFMQTLGEYIGSEMPVDPVNTGSTYYQYLSLNDGYTLNGSCTISEPFYILKVTYKSPSNNPTSPGTAAVTCDSETAWAATGVVRYIAPPQAKQ